MILRYASFVLALNVTACVAAQQMDIAAMARKAKVKLIIPDSTFDAIDFLEHVHADTTMLVAFRNIQITSHRFKGHLEVSKWRKYNPTNSIDWFGHWSISTGLAAVKLDSVRTEGCLRKRDRKRLYFIENWISARFGEYARMSSDSVRRVAAEGLRQNRYTSRATTEIDQCLNGLWPGITPDGNMTYLDHFDGSVVANYGYSIKDESYDGNWAIPYCLVVGKDPEVKWREAPLAPCTYCFDRESRQAMKVDGQFAQGRTWIYFLLETGIDGGTVFGEYIYVTGSIPVSFWRREHFVFALYLYPPSRF